MGRTVAFLSCRIWRMQRREFLTASSVALLGLAVQGEMPVSAAAA